MTIVAGPWEAVIGLQPELLVRRMVDVSMGLSAEMFSWKRSGPEHGVTPAGDRGGESVLGAVGERKDGVDTGAATGGALHAQASAQRLGALAHGA